MGPSLSPFDLVSNNLRALGALSISEFLSARPEELSRPDAIYDSTYDISPSLASLPSGSASSKKTPPSTGNSVATDTSQNVARLHHACQRVFGQSNGLNFEFLEEGVDKKQCILTIMRPDGAVRSYKSKPIFRRKNDAKAEVATIAVEHGALDFIVHGDSDALKAKKGVLLAPLENEPQPVASTAELSLNTRTSKKFLPEAGTPMQQYKQIEACCKEWRGTLVYPSWHDFDTGNQYGAVLKIQLATHCCRVYSCEPTFDSPSKAREHCAALAVNDGVLKFIKHGNGQSTPRSDQTEPFLPYDRQIRSVQRFYEELPRPFEEPFEDKTASEINAPGWLSKLLVGAKGARFTADFYSLVAPNGTTPYHLLHGCLLRLKRPEECRSYFVEPQFGLQKDAKVAVSLLALSQGAGKYIRETGAAVEARITPTMRNFVQKSVFHTLTAETQQISGSAPKYESFTADDAFGCKLYVFLKPKPNDSETDRRQYIVPAEYRSKADAKIAVAYLAAEKGVFDVLRFGGQPIPPGHEPAFKIQDGVPQIAQKLQKPKNKKNKKNRSEPEGPPSKKRKMDVASSASVSGFSVPTPTSGFVAPVPTMAFSLPPKPANSMAYGDPRSSKRAFETYAATNPTRSGSRTIQMARKSTSGAPIRRSPSLEDGELVDDD
ncbi:hypothetical protein B0H11DRAFT_1328411 [Mycena galericulata]|nr:hypothetical protein B0H11DRAFT_1328411 [Mycena galericulata]